MSNTESNVSGVASTASKTITTFDPSFAPFIKDIFGVESIDRRRVLHAFYKQYRGLVVHELAKRNKYTQNFEDVEAKLWLDFMGTTESTGLIDKFFGQVKETGWDLPETMTGEEVTTMLFSNVSWETWSGHVSWATEAPLPIDGGKHSDRNAVYNTEAVLVWVNETKGCPDAWTLKLPQMKATKKHFINYLKRCIVNRWANFCRTESRRHQERPWDTFADQRSNHEDPESWEDRQKAPAMQEFSTEINLLCAKLRTTPAGMHIKSILDSVADHGFTIYEAINRCESLSEADKRTSVRTVSGYRTETRETRLKIVAA